MEYKGDKGDIKGQMPKRPLIILHGWSADSGNLKTLSAFLKKNGFKVVDIWLADYVSMNDEITIQDLGQAMGKAIDANRISQAPHSFDVVVHSTGGLVVRQYLIHYFFGQPGKCPIQHLLMLAPANFGSPLAHLGQSMIGRLRVGWKWDHFMQSGARILDALQLASPISWRMAERDLFNPENRLFVPPNIYTTVLVGTDAYEGLAGTIHEKGSDGTVRVSTANLNASSIKIVFTEKNHRLIRQEPCYEPIAFGVLYGKNHGSIISPEDSDEQFRDLVVTSLTVGTKGDYKKHITHLQQVTENTFAEGIQEAVKPDWYHQYQNVVIKVHDQFGESINDYFIEFYQEKGDAKDNVLQKIQTEILEKVVSYSGDASYRSFLFDITDMKSKILDEGNKMDMSLCAAAISERISYVDPKAHLTVVSEDDQTFLQPNTTLFVDIELPRIQSEKVFQLKKV